jgi:protein TonB
MGALAIGRLFAPLQGRTGAARARFSALLVFCFAAHLALLGFFLREDALDAGSVARQVEEIPVEVVMEPPPPEKTEEAPPPKEEEQKPPALKKQEMTLDVKPAIDAPKEASKEKAESDAPDKETRAQRVAPAPKEAAAKPEPAAAPKDARDDAARLEPDDALRRAPEEKPDAEIVERAEPAPPAPEKQARKGAKPAPKQGEAKSIAEQVAAMEPLPELKVGGGGKPSPVGGGNAKTTYLTILYGLIMQKIRPPQGLPPRRVANVAIRFYLDEMGNLTHQAIERESGSREIDLVALNAVRRAAPFPPPPPGHPRLLIFNYGPK